ECMTGGRIVVRGATGRNFGAGMSGAVASLHDADANRVNDEMVEVEPLDTADRELVEELVRRHAVETGSVLAVGLLADWSSSIQRFAKVMPRDYKRVLAARSKAEQEGLDVNEQIMAAAHG